MGGNLSQLPQGVVLIRYPAQMDSGLETAQALYGLTTDNQVPTLISNAC